MPERDYSFRTLIDKLNVREGSRVLVLGVNDETLLAEIRGRTEDCAVGRKKANRDVILLGAEGPGDLRKVESCRELLAPAGGLWIVYPKRQKHITEKLAIAAGLVDNKVVSFLATHTGLRFVIRKTDRPM
jgi:hypothetical protein